MRQIVLVSGVLGGGTALVFALAAVVATMFPNGTLVAANPWAGQFNNRVMPAVGAPLVVDDSGSGSSGQILETIGSEIPADVGVTDPSPEP